MAQVDEIVPKDQMEMETMEKETVQEPAKETVQEPAKDDQQDGDAVFKVPEMGTFEPYHVVIAPMEIPESIFSENQTGIKWLPMVTETAAQIAEFVVDQLEQARPRCITVMALQNAMRVEAMETVDDVKGAIDTVVDCWRLNTRHRVVFTTLIFTPNEVEEWGNIAEVNGHIHQANKQMSMQPLRIHRIFLSKQRGENVLVVNGSRFVEFNNKTGLGDTPTLEALKLIVKWILLHHRRGMFNRDVPASCPETALMMPTPLGFTEGYHNCTILSQILRQRGQFVSRRSRSTSRRREPNTKPVKRVTSAEQGRFPRKQRVSSVTDNEDPSQLLVRKLSEAYRQNAEMYRVDAAKEKAAENKKLESLYLLFHEKAEKLKEMEKRYEQLLYTRQPEEQRKDSAEIRRLKTRNKELLEDNYWLERENERLARRFQDLGRQYDDVYADLLIWKKRAEGKTTIRWSTKSDRDARAPTKKISHKRKD